jgi:MOSC domain-containing protein YiiM
LAIIEGVFVGSPKTLRDERGEWVSSIVRKRIDGPVGLCSEGFDGDKVTQPYHGGPEAAACVHLADHYDFWRDHYGIDLNHGHLGENIVLTGMKEEQIYVGDIVRIGSALVQVSGPRVPCETQARRVGRADWVRLTIRENRTGFYLRVLETGAIQNQDGWLLLERLNERGSIPRINRCLYLDFEIDLAREFSEMAGLAEWWREQFRERLTRTGPHWSEEILQPDEVPVHTTESKMD